MPITDFAQLPPSARVWVFAADRPLPRDARDTLLAAVDDYLRRWAAHGEPLTSARHWSDDRFLVIGVDQRDAHASGCSIDGLFRTLQRLEPALGASLVGSGRVYWRDAEGRVVGADRGDFAARVRGGEIGRDTPVFDQTVETLGDWRERFEAPAGRSWVRALL